MSRFFTADDFPCLQTLHEQLTKTHKDMTEAGIAGLGQMVVYVNQPFYHDLLREYHSIAFQYGCPVKLRFGTFLETVNGVPFYAVMGDHHPRIKISVNTELSALRNESI